MTIWHLFVPIKKRNLDFMSYIRHKLSECLNIVKFAVEIKGLLELKLEPFEHPPSQLNNSPQPEWIQKAK
jgi:hypothetical protein